MNMIRNIWMLLTGFDRELNQLNAKIDQVLAFQADLIPKLAGIATNQRALNAKLDEALEIIRKVQAELSPPPAVALVITLRGVSKGENGMQVADNGKVDAVLEADDAVGNAGAALDSPPAWSVSDSAMASVSPAADGMSAVVTPSGKLGSFSIHAEATAGGKPLSADSESIDVVVGAASSLKVTLTAE